MPGLVPAQGPEKHLDPPAPPRYDEFVYLYELTLLEDQDDPWIAFDGGTELMIRTKITKPGHETWACDHADRRHRHGWRSLR